MKAHKMILDMVSPKLCMMSGKQVNKYTVEVAKEDTVEVAKEDTKEVAFKVVIDAIYNVKSVEESLGKRSR